MNAEFVIFWGTGAYEANFGKTPMAEKVTRSLGERNFKMAVVDPRLSKTAGRAHWWLPVKPGADGALAMGMIRGRPSRFLRASEAGIGGEHQFVVSREAKLIAVTPKDEDSPVHGDLFVSTTINGRTAKTSLLLLRERAEGKSLAEWADINGVPARQIAEVAEEFTSHGKKEAIDFYRGPAQHANGYYSCIAINSLNFLIGNVDWKGGYSAGGGHWHGFGGKPGNPYNFGRLHPNKLTKFGMTQSREGWSYEETTCSGSRDTPPNAPSTPSPAACTPRCQLAPPRGIPTP